MQQHECLPAPQQQARKVEKLYKSLFEHSCSVMLIIHPKSGSIPDANIAACNFYGYTRDELKHMKILDINTLSAEAVYREMQQAKHEKRHHFNFKHKLANGELRDVEVFSGPIVIGGEKLLYSIINDISERLKIERERNRLIAELKQALSEIKTLRGILPICASCKKIRDDKGYWKQIEAYIREHSEAHFSHSICPECAEKLYPDLNGIH